MLLRLHPFHPFYHIFHQVQHPDTISSGIIMNVQFIYDNNDVSRDKDETSTYALLSGFPEILPILDLICI